MIDYYFEFVVCIVKICDRLLIPLFLLIYVIYDRFRYLILLPFLIDSCFESAIYFVQICEYYYFVPFFY